MLIVTQQYNEVGKYVEDVVLDTNEKHPLYDDSQDDHKAWLQAIQNPTERTSEEDIKGLTLR